MIADLQPKFTLGSLRLDMEPYLVEFGQDWGVGLNETQSIDTALLDGDYLRTIRTGNRTLTVTVLIEASNLNYLAQAESALIEECNREMNTFTVDPGGVGEVTVFQTYRTQVRYVRNDEFEINGFRRYVLTMPAHPWGFAQDPTVTIASTTAPVTPSTTTISDGTSTTGWASPAGAAAQPSVSSGKLKIASRTASGDSPYVSEATRTLSPTDFSATPFITAELKAAAGMRFSPILEGSSGVQYTYNDSGDQFLRWGAMDDNPAAWAGAYVDDVRLPLVTAQPLSDGTVRYTWRCDATAGVALRFVAGTEESTEASVTPTNGGFLLDNVTRSNVNPAASSSGRQSLRTLVVEGSARTAPSIAIEHPTSALGEVVFYTSSALGSAGFGGPSLRPFMTAGSPTTDTGAVSGAYVRTAADTSNFQTYTIPTSLLPAGTYLIAMRARTGTGASGKIIQTTVSQIEGSTEFGEIILPGTITTGAAGAWSPITVLGAITLPRQKTPVESSATVQFHVVNAPEGAGTGTWDVDDIWVFHLDEGSDITRVDCGTGSPSLGVRHNRLWMDVATPTRPEPGLYVGTAEYRADAFDPGYPAVINRGVHPLTPPTSQCFVITTGARNPTITYTYTSAWHTHVGHVGS